MVRSLVSLFFVTALSLHAEERKEAPARHGEKPRHLAPEQGRDAGLVEKVPVTFLGVETAPAGRTLASQLALPADIGLVVVRTMDGSPAAGLLKEHDILTKFDDQLLVDGRQLSVLVRARKEGEEVALTLYRAGKEMILRVKLGQREMPRTIGRDGLPGADANLGFFNEGMPGPGELWTRRLPGMERDDVHNVLRMIGRERRNWFGAPPVHFFRREGGRDSTMLNLAEGNFVFSDDSGSVEVKAGEGKRELTVKNAKGEITFQGPIHGAADREKLPPEVRERLHKIESVELNDEPDEDFEMESAIEPPAGAEFGQPLEPERGERRGSPPSSF